MKQKTNSRSDVLMWTICVLLALAGIALAVRALLNFNQANVVVEWSTASELDTVGFNLLRAESPTGPFEQINTELIPSASDTLTGNEYAYEDELTTAGITYYYMLEEIEATGATNQHGPIVVTASSSAKIELLVAVLLLVGAIIYTVILIREKKQLQAPAGSARAR